MEILFYIIFSLILGQLCMSNLGSTLDETNHAVQQKKYKFSVTLDEYSTHSERIVSLSNEVDLAKNTIDYESDWIDISNEEVTPFYREKQQYKVNCLYLNKCWLDLKLYPVGAKRDEAKFKLIYLVLQSDECSPRVNAEETEGNSGEGGEKSPSEPVTRVLTIQSKFLFANKTKLDLKLQIEDDFLSTKKYAKRFIESSTDDEDHIIKSNSAHFTGNVVNKNNFYLKQGSEKADPSVELDEDSIDKENINDLFYLRFISTNHAVRGVKQSKPLVLTVKEKAIKQVAPNAQIDDNLLVSRQCFCLYR